MGMVLYNDKGEVEFSAHRATVWCEQVDAAANAILWALDLVAKRRGTASRVHRCRVRRRTKGTPGLPSSAGRS
jgi:hypothetical protein